jgi:hypothetical protein
MRLENGASGWSVPPTFSVSGLSSGSPRSSRRVARMAAIQGGALRSTPRFLGSLRVSLSSRCCDGGGNAVLLPQGLPYSSWRRHQTPVSLRPFGARSSH